MKRSAVLLATLAGLAFSQTPGLQLDPPHTFGQGVTAAFEGWYANPDGSANILVGYYNRNLKEALDIPVGPNNRIEPGGPDLGQPTHFDPGRQWGVFTMTVPKGFAPDKKITWTIVANGKTAAIPLSLNPLWNISPFSDATGNTPPFIGFQESGPFLQGPPRGLGNSVAVNSHDALPLTVWVSDDAKV